LGICFDLDKSRGCAQNNLVSVVFFISWIYKKNSVSYFLAVISLRPHFYRVGEILPVRSIRYFVTFEVN